MCAPRCDPDAAPGNIAANACSGHCAQCITARVGTPADPYGIARPCRNRRRNAMTTTMRLLPVRTTPALRALIDRAGPVNAATRALIILGARRGA